MRIALPPQQLTPECEPDEKGWIVVIQSAGLVQVSTACLCGDEYHGWHAASYRKDWTNS